MATVCAPVRTSAGKPVPVRVEKGSITGACHVRNPEKLPGTERAAAVSR